MYSDIWLPDLLDSANSLNSLFSRRLNWKNFMKLLRRVIQRFLINYIMLYDVNKIGKLKYI